MILVFNAPERRTNTDIFRRKSEKGSLRLSWNSHMELRINQMTMSSGNTEACAAAKLRELILVSRYVCAQELAVI